MARLLEDSVENINRVEIKDLKANFSLPDWINDLNEDNSSLNKILNSSFFKRKERFEKEHYIDMTKFKLFGILHCKGEIMMKV